MSLVSGKKGGSSKQRPPRETPDSLVSIAYARIVDLVSEGEIEGLVNGEASIYLDETPGRSGGQPTFPSLRWDFRAGTQDQSHIPGFAQVENNIGVGTELRAESPYVRSVTNLDLSALRINIAVPRLSSQDTSSGDTNGYRINYAVDVAEGMGAYVEVLTGAFDGKTAGGYERSIRVDLNGRPAGGWRVRVRRLTPNSEASTIADTTNITSITEIIDAKFRYPNSALVALEFDAEVFGGSVPRRGYHLRGRIIRVPTNYNPVTRTYTGLWDGTFKTEYSNNPAWVYYDLLLHRRYGLGERVDATQVDKWGLYQIAQYCDQLVPDGKGGMEPRFTCNLYLQRAADAYKVMQDLASIFRGITYWGAGQAYVSADMPSDAAYTYTNANVIGGKFNYKGSKRSTRYSAALVSWNDPTDMYRAKIEYVQDDAAVARFGVQKTEIIATGCTSQGQAQRAGKWLIATNLLEAEVVNFAVGIEGIRGRPGQVIRVADNDRAGRRIGGRVVSATTSAIIVDKVAGVQAGDDLTCIMPSGLPETRTVLSVSGNQINVSSFSAAPVAHSVWAWESETLAAQWFRIISIGESGPLEYTITASKYVPGKHEGVDTGAIISQRPISNIPSSVQAAPENVRLESDWMIEQTMAVTTMTIMWDAAPGATRYDVEWRRSENDWVYAGRVATTEIEVRGIYAGLYQARVRAINSLDIQSLAGYSGFVQLDGKTGSPPGVAFLSTESLIFGISLKWGFPSGAGDTARTEIRYNTSPSETGAMQLGDYAYPTNSYVMTGLAAAVRFYFSARLVDRTGNVGPWSSWVMGESSSDATEILDYIAGQISETELSQHLRDEIELISGNGPGSVNERVAEVNDRVDVISAELDDIVGAPEWDVSEPYLSGSLVKFDGGLFRAAQDVPAGTPTSNTAYWERLGDYDSLGDLVSALAVRMTQAETGIDDVTGDVAAQSLLIDGLQISVTTAQGTADDAALAAQDASDLAGGKGKVFFQNAAPGVDDRLPQNLWIDTTGGNNTPKRWNGTAWVAVTDKVATDAAAAAQNALDGLDAKADLSALSLLEGTVNQQGDDISAQGLALTALQGSIESAELDIAANAEAIEDIQTDVSIIDGQVQATASRLDYINASTRPVRADGDKAAALQGYYAQASYAQSVTVQATATEAVVKSQETLVAEVGENSAAIQQTSQVVASLDGDLSSMWAVKMQLNTSNQYVFAGIGLGIENTPGGLQSQFLIEADRFAVLNTVNGQVTSPFVVQGGQTFINSAVIGNASIGSAKLADWIESDALGPGGVPVLRLNFRTGEIQMNSPVVGGGRMTLNNQRIEIRDASNALIMRMGSW